ncbi:MAG: hypothetical protein KatS3mg078_1540 [Deltaproteobacteria bacterium]|nr:MAG: hypothetical protein KatS3mg078_1540 [Deltaproteobacteria bacterium]
MITPLYLPFAILLGGQDELVFDGHSVVINERGDVVARAGGFREEMLVVDININRVFRSRLHDPRRRKEKYALELESRRAEVVEVGGFAEKEKPPITTGVADFLELEEEVFRALVLGTRDYVTKKRF